MKTAIYTAVISSAALCAVLMIIGLYFCEPLLHLIKTPSELFTDSKLYLDIYIWGLPFVFFYNIATGIFSALGDSKTPFFFLAASSISNIAVDILFVTKLHMGVDGVAWATFICQGISCLLAITVIFYRLKKIPSEAGTVAFSFSIFKKFMTVAIPSILQQSFVSVGNIIIQSVINGFGSGVIAGYSAAVKLNNLVITSFTTLGNGISNYTAQNIGAQKLQRVKEGFTAGLKLVWLLSIPLFSIYFFAGKWLVYLFLDKPTATALKTGVTFLQILSPFYFVIAAKLVADAILRGAGTMKEFMLSTFTDLVLRVALAVILSQTALGATGIWCAWPLGWTTATVISITFYKSGRWKKLA